MIIISECSNGEKMYFNDFEEIKKYYNYNDAYDLDELQEFLEEKADGREYPKLTLTNNFEVECWWRGNNFEGGYMFDTLKEAQYKFNEIIEELQKIYEEYKHVENKEEYIKEQVESDGLYDYVQINQFDEFERIEVLQNKEFVW